MQIGNLTYGRLAFLNDLPAGTVLLRVGSCISYVKLAKNLYYRFVLLGSLTDRQIFVDTQFMLNMGLSSEHSIRSITILKPC